MPEDTSTVLRRVAGLANTGVVTLRDFDQGVVETLGAVVREDAPQTGYYLTIDGVEGPTGYPGIPVVWNHPEDVFGKYLLPYVMIRRDDLQPALQRWHPGTVQFKAPAPGALPKQATVLGKIRNGWDKMEFVHQAVPFDLTYTVQIGARHRGSLNAANSILHHVLRRYQPYTAVLVKDSVGDTRSYEAFMESTSAIDETFEIADRVLGFALTLRVEGELDLNDPVVQQTVLSTPTIRLEPI